MQVKWHSSAARSDIARFKPGIQHDRNTRNQSIIRNPWIRLNRSTACRTRSDANVAIESIRVYGGSTFATVHNVFAIIVDRWPNSCRHFSTPTGRKIALRLRRNWLVVVQAIIYAVGGISVDVTTPTDET